MPDGPDYSRWMTSAALAGTANLPTGISAGVAFL
jgi:hypothetical protein